MKNIYLIVLLLIIILFVIYIPPLESFSIIEGANGGGGGGRGGGGRGGGGRGGGGRGGGGRGGGGRGGRGHHGHHHSGRRRWYGGNWGYRYNRPPRLGYYPRYVPWWTSMYWFGNDCKDGCTNIGNNNWGCQYPGYGVDDCIFASDCYGCGI